VIVFSQSTVLIRSTECMEYGEDTQIGTQKHIKRCRVFHRQEIRKGT